MFETFITNLKNKIEKPLPGISAQYEMAHVNREKILLTSNESKEYKPSAVLILLFPNNNNQPTILLIERNSYIGYHSGQIALPGGKAEISDDNLQSTALREYFEETGSDIIPTIIGKLTPVYIPVSKFMVQPYIAYANKKPKFSINTREVAELIEWEMVHLLDNNTIKETTVEPTFGYKFKTPFFDVHGKVLWGATAMMLNELKCIINTHS
jgi:8-oxo-dGTP pyrophosphatase MutT (NUDIX family)